MKNPQVSPSKTCGIISDLEAKASLKKKTTQVSSTYLTMGIDLALTKKSDWFTLKITNNCTNSVNKTLN